MTKLANPIVVVVNIVAILEAFVLATQVGVEPKVVYKSSRGRVAGSTVMDAKSSLIIDRKFDPGFPHRVPLKRSSECQANGLRTACPASHERSDSGR
jgi:2-hydroxy-3-oxopropionate reductase